MKYLTIRLGTPDCVFPLAQEVTAFPSRIYDDDPDHRSHRHNQENFHAHRIAPSRKSVLYRELANAKQLCKSDFWMF